MYKRRSLAVAVALAASAWLGAQTTRPAAAPSTRPASATTRPLIAPATQPAAVAATQPSVGASPTTMPGFPSADQAIVRLASPDWRERRKARDDLVRLGEAGKPFIEELIRRAPAEEARKNAQAALVEIDQNRLLGPSYVTLHVKDASAREVFAELSKQCFAPLLTMPENLWDQGGFPKLTLNIDHKAFWEAVPPICQQLGVDFRPYNTGMRIMRSGGMQVQGMARVDGPFLIVANQLSYSRTRTFGQVQGEQTQFGMNLSVFPEPKITVLRSSGTVTLDEAIDNHGHSLVPQAAVPRNGFGGYYYGGLGLYAQLEYPKKDPGTRIVRFKGSTSFIIQTKVQRMEIPDLMHLRQTTKLINGSQITFQEMKKTAGDTYQLRLRIAQSNIGGPEWQQLVEGVQSRMQVVDSEGNPLDHRGMSSSGNNDSIDMTLDFAHAARPDGRPTGEPAKIVWDIPTETREITLPIEFKDLPMFENK